MAAGLVAVDNVVVNPPAAEAASGKDFKPGNIISDVVFFNSNTMSVNAIQKFLESKVSKCAAGYTCLIDYTETTRNMAKDPMCAAYAGARNESAATIIYKVAKACGINPQVILTTLQKEQGFITDDWPSARMYRTAMGYGCPDDGDCDSEYYGFFNQVYKGAWAFKRYTMPEGTGPGTYWNTMYTWYPVGKPSQIRYFPLPKPGKPDLCPGTKTVTITNKATASLYYYTPYVPNEAALAAGYGTGNSCSAYGNRNFFLYFTDWFGETQGFAPHAKLKPLHTELGGYSGKLGYGVDVAKSYSDGVIGQAFQNKSAAYWSADKGAFATFGYISQEYAKAGGPDSIYGIPIGAEKSEAGGGTSQAFKNALLYNTSGWVTHRILNVMNAGYRALGGPKGVLGIPIDSEKPAANKGYRQSFEKGVLYWSKATGAISVPNAIDPYYTSLGGPGGGLGYPIAEVITTPEGESRVTFENGVITWSDSSAPTSSLSQAPKVDRIAGDDRYETAIAISKAGYPKTASVVYVTTGTDYPDALAAAPAAAQQGGPLLLTPTKALPSAVKKEIQRLKPTRIVVIGGEDAVSKKVFTDLKALAKKTERIGGLDRYETSRLIVESAFPSAEAAYIATGENFPDALSASAAGGALDAPVILVDGRKDSIDKPTKALLSSLGVTKTTIAGGEDVISTGIKKSLDAISKSTRMAGADRFETSRKVNKTAFPTVDRVLLATGTMFPDALAGAALAGAKGAPVYLVNKTCVAPEVLTDVKASTAKQVTLLGGTDVLRKEVASLTGC